MLTSIEFWYTVRKFLTLATVIAAVTPTGVSPAADLPKDSAIPQTDGVIRTGSANGRLGRYPYKWDVEFGRVPAKEYLDRLRAMDIRLVVLSNNGKEMLIEDLSARPAKLVEFSNRDLKRYRLIDANESSVRSVAAELNIEPPRELRLYFPIRMEECLLKKQLEFKERREQDLTYTRFKVLFEGRTHSIKVVEQRSR